MRLRALLFLFLLPLWGTTQKPESITYQQTGVASYYAWGFHMRRTSSGEVYHRDSLTCAHRTLPFGTRLKVTNLSNQKSVFVKVNDRGPFSRGRVIDLSYAAAKTIGILASGLAKVRIEQVTGLPKTE